MRRTSPAKQRAGRHLACLPTALGPTIICLRVACCLLFVFCYSFVIVCFFLCLFVCLVSCFGPIDCTFLRRFVVWFWLRGCDCCWCGHCCHCYKCCYCCKCCHCCYCCKCGHCCWLSLSLFLFVCLLLSVVRAYKLSFSIT